MPAHPIKLKSKWLDQNAADCDADVGAAKRLFRLSTKPTTDCSHHRRMMGNGNLERFLDTLFLGITAISELICSFEYPAIIPYRYAPFDLAKRRFRTAPLPTTRKAECGCGGIAYNSLHILRNLGFLNSLRYRGWARVQIDIDPNGKGHLVTECPFSVDEIRKMLRTSALIRCDTGLLIEFAANNEIHSRFYNGDDLERWERIKPPCTICDELPDNPNGIFCPHECACK